MEKDHVMQTATLPSCLGNAIAYLWLPARLCSIMMMGMMWLHELVPPTWEASAPWVAPQGSVRLLKQNNHRNPGPVQAPPTCLRQGEAFARANGQVE